LRNRGVTKSACAAAPWGIRSENIICKTTVPRKPKPSVENKPAESAGAPSANGKADSVEPKKKARAAAAAPLKKKPATPKKSSEKKASTPVAAVAAEPTEEQIRLRAYFIAERRHKLSLPGDSNHDWIEARRQLIEEAKR
jgi:hypothetical protein